MLLRGLGAPLDRRHSRHPPGDGVRRPSGRDRPGRAAPGGPDAELYARPATTIVAVTVGDPGMSLVPAVIGDGVLVLGDRRLPFPGSGEKLWGRTAAGRCWRASGRRRWPSFRPSGDALAAQRRVGRAPRRGRGRTHAPASWQPAKSSCERRGRPASSGRRGPSRHRPLTRVDLRPRHRPAPSGTPPDPLINFGCPTSRIDQTVSGRWRRGRRPWWGRGDEQLAGDGVATAERLRLIDAHVARPEASGPRQHLVDILGEGDTAPQLDERVRRSLVVDADGDSRVAAQDLGFERLSVAREHQVAGVVVEHEPDRNDVGLAAGEGGGQLAGTGALGHERPPLLVGHGSGHGADGRAQE